MTVPTRSELQTARPCVQENSFERKKLDEFNLWCCFPKHIAGCRSCPPCLSILYESTKLASQQDLSARRELASLPKGLISIPPTILLPGEHRGGTNIGGNLLMPSSSVTVILYCGTGKGPRLGPIRIRTAYVMVLGVLSQCRSLDSKVLVLFLWTRVQPPPGGWGMGGALWWEVSSQE